MGSTICSIHSRKAQMVWRPRSGGSWKVDETYIKVKGKWVYLYRAVDKRGETIDFFLSTARNAKAAQRFLAKAIRGLKSWEYPHTIKTDKASAYGVAIRELKTQGKCPNEVVHRQVRYLNNAVEADHGKLKRLIYPVRGLKIMKTAYATLKGFEVMHMFKKGQFEMWQYGRGAAGEICIITNALMRA